MNIELQTVTLPKSGPFDMRVEFYDETDISMRKHFVNECGWTEDQFEEIEGYEWVRIEVIASFDGVDYGTAHLGGCCYRDQADFMGDSLETMASGYMPQMIAEAVAEAKETVYRQMDVLNDRVLKLSGLILELAKAE